MMGERILAGVIAKVQEKLVRVMNSGCASVKRAEE
jgi:hypothetical protein